MSIWILNESSTTLKDLKVEGPEGKNNRKSKVKNGAVQTFKALKLKEECHLLTKHRG